MCVCVCVCVCVWRGVVVIVSERESAVVARERVCVLGGGMGGGGVGIPEVIGLCQTVGKRSRDGWPGRRFRQASSAKSVKSSASLARSDCR